MSDAPRLHPKHNRPVTNEDLEEQMPLGYCYKHPDYVEGSHEMERGEVTYHHVWPHMPQLEKPSDANKKQTEG